MGGEERQQGECDALPGGDVKDMEGEKVVSVDIAGRREGFLRWLFLIEL